MLTNDVLDGLLDELADRVAERLASAPSPSPSPASEGWRLFSVGELAERMGRSTRWVHEAVKTRGLPYVRLDGGGKAFDLEDVRVWALTRSDLIPREGG